MESTQKIMAEMEREAESTKKILACVPADKFDWQPHEKSMTLKQLASHIANLQAMAAAAITSDAHFDLIDIPATEINTTEDIVALMETGLKNSLAALKDADGSDWDADFELRYDSKVLMKMPKGVFIRKMGISHLYHHRGQLSVYLRLLNIPIPGMYGPSADEK